MSIGSLTALEVIAITRPWPLASRCGRQRRTSRIAESSRSSTAVLDRLVGDVERRVPVGGPPLFQTTMSIAAERVDGGLDEPLEVGRTC